MRANSTTYLMSSLYSSTSSCWRDNAAAAALAASPPAAAPARATGATIRLWRYAPITFTAESFSNTPKDCAAPASSALPALPLLFLPPLPTAFFLPPPPPGLAAVDEEGIRMDLHMRRTGSAFASVMTLA